jgi:hypothetical protein
MSVALGERNKGVGSARLGKGGSARLGAGVPAVLNEAVLWLDARYSVAGEQEVVNRGTGGAALNARYGSATGVDTNDPLLLPHTGENYVYHPGNQSLSTAVSVEHTPGSIVTITAQAHVFGTVAELGGKIAGGGGVAAYISNSRLNIYWSGPSGAQFLDLGATTVGTRYWYRVVLNTATGGATGYDSADGVTWRTMASGTAAAGISAGAAGWRIGAAGLAVGGDLSTHSFRYEEGANTLLLFEAANNITNSAATTFTATSGQIFTVNRATTGRKTTLVTRPIWLFGTDDYMEVPDHPLLNFDASDNFTVLAVTRHWATPHAAFHTILAKMNSLGASQGWALMGSSSSVQFRTRDAATTSINAFQVPTLGPIMLAVGRRSGTSNTVQLHQTTGVLTETHVTPPALDTTNTNVLRMGINTTGGQVWHGEAAGYAVFRRALTDAEIALIANFYGTV